MICRFFHYLKFQLPSTQEYRKGKNKSLGLLNLKPILPCTDIKFIPYRSVCGRSKVSYHSAYGNKKKNTQDQ